MLLFLYHCDRVCTVYRVPIGHVVWHFAMPIYRMANNDIFFWIDVYTWNNTRIFRPSLKRHADQWSFIYRVPRNKRTLLLLLLFVLNSSRAESRVYVIAKLKAAALHLQYIIFLFFDFLFVYLDSILHELQMKIINIYVCSCMKCNNYDACIIMNNINIDLLCWFDQGHGGGGEPKKVVIPSVAVDTLKRRYHCAMC